MCRGKRVLITSYTHSAVDNLLLKLREKGVHFLRLGRPSQVSSQSNHDRLLELERLTVCTRMGMGVNMGAYSLADPSNAFSSLLYISVCIGVYVTFIKLRVLDRFASLTHVSFPLLPSLWL